VDGGMRAAAAARPVPLSEAQATAKVDRIISELAQSTSPTSVRVWWPVLVLALMALLLSRAQGRTLALGAVLLLYAALWHFGGNYNTRYGLDEVTAPPKTLRAIQKSGRAGRTATVDRRRHPTLDTALIASSMGLVHGTQDVLITSPLRMVRTEALLSKVGLDVGDRGRAKWDRLREEPGLLDLLGVRWLLSEHLIEDPRYPQRQFGEVQLYENPSALPGAFVVGCSLPSTDPWADMEKLEPRKQVVTEGALAVPRCADGRESGTARLERLSPELLRIQVNAERQVMLVQTDSFYPGWTAELDGVPVPLHRVNLIFRGVIVSKGLHEIVLRYTPTPLRRSLWVGLGAAILLSLLSLLGLFRGRGGQQREAGRS